MNFIKKFAYVTFPLLFAFGLLGTFGVFNTKLTFGLLLGINFLIISFLLLVIKLEGANGLPYGLGEIATGSTYIISICTSLLTLFIFLLALNKVAVGL